LGGSKGDEGFADVFSSACNQHSMIALLYLGGNFLNKIAADFIWGVEV
jgi:hypothetical protein